MMTELIEFNKKIQLILVDNASICLKTYSVGWKFNYFV